MKRRSSSYFAFQLFDVLQDWLQILMCICYLGVIFGHVVLLQLLLLQTKNSLVSNFKMKWQM